MDLHEFIDRERREAVIEVAEENKKVKAELDRIKNDQRSFQKLTSILLDKNLVDELKRAADDEAYKESLYVEYGIGRSHMDLS